MLDREDFLLGAWRKKESIFKRWGGRTLSPSSIDTTAARVHCGIVEINGKECTFSVATDTPECVRIYPSVDISDR